MYYTPNTHNHNASLLSVVLYQVKEEKHYLISLKTWLYLLVETQVTHISPPNIPNPTA